MKIPLATLDYLEGMAQMFRARHEGKEDLEILDRLDNAWERMSEKERTFSEEISKALGKISLD